jgi:hypothetical protein
MLAEPSTKTQRRKNMAKKASTNTGTNLEKLKQAFDASKGSGGGNYNWWRPEWGDNVVRILPSMDPDGLFFQETARHRINGEQFYCLKYDIDRETGRGKGCPICEARTRLFRSGDKDLIKIAKEIKAKKQYLMNLINRKSEDPTIVYVYGAGIKIWSKMVTTMLDDEVDITDVVNGYDFRVKKEEGPKTEFGQFPSYDNSKPVTKSSPLHEDPKIAQKILEARNDLTKIARFDDESILQAAVDTYIKSLTDPESGEKFYDVEGEESKAAAPAKSSEKAKATLTDFRARLINRIKTESDEDAE